MLRLSLAFALVLCPVFLPAAGIVTTLPHHVPTSGETRLTKDQKLTVLRTLIEKGKWSELGHRIRKAVDNHSITLRDLQNFSDSLNSPAFSTALLSSKKILSLSEKTGLSLGTTFQIALFAETDLKNEIAKGKFFWKENVFGRELEYDKNSKRLYIHLGTHGVKPIGIGRKKVVTKTIRYDSASPKIMARGVMDCGCDHEVYALKKLKDVPNVLSAEAIMRHKDPKSGKVITSIVTKIIRPGSLHSILEDHSWKLTLKERVKIACDIMKGIAGMQELGFVHRDLGAKNYFVDIKGTKPGHRKITAYVADLGRTRPYKSAKDIPVQGNSAYAPPEAIYRAKMKGKQYCNSDLFAVGCVFWQLYFGELPAWCQSEFYKNESASKSARYNAKVYHINSIRSHYSATLKKTMKKNHKPSLKESFLQLILSMTDPVPSKRGEANLLYSQLHTLVYGKPPAKKKDDTSSSQQGSPSQQNTSQSRGEKNQKK